MDLSAYRPVTPGIKLVVAFCKHAMLSRGDEQPWYLLTCLGDVPAHRRETVVVCRCGRRSPAMFEFGGPAQVTSPFTHVRLNKLQFGIRDRRWTFHVGQCSRCQACLWAVQATRARNRRIRPGLPPNLETVGPC